MNMVRRSNAYHFWELDQLENEPIGINMKHEECVAIQVEVEVDQGTPCRTFANFN